LLAEEALMAEKKTKSSDQQAVALARANSTSINLCFFQADGSPVSGLTGVEARASSPCGGEEGCWQKLDTSNQLLAPTGKMLQIDAQGTVNEKGGSCTVSFLPALVTLGCDKGNPLEVCMELKECPPTREENLTVTLRAHRCVSREDHGDRVSVARIASATAEPFLTKRLKNPAQLPTALFKKPVTLPATIVDGVAFFNLPKGNFRFDACLEEECASTRPSFPFTCCVDEDSEICICAEPRERVVTLLFVDACGNACGPTEVFLDHEGQTRALPEGQGGTYRLTGLEAGRLRLISRGYRFKPEEIHLDHRMNQVHLFEATAVVGAIGSVEREEIVLEFAEKLEEGDQGSFKILTLEGKLVDTIDAGSGRPVLYSPTDGQGLMIQGWRNGVVVDQICHPASK
jgi:hypothetical protein